MEETAKVIATYLSLVIEVLAAVVIGIALLKFLLNYIPTFFQKDQHISNTLLRVKFGSSLTLALELLLAADILQTAIAPTWDDIGKLGAIAFIRTVLNYFLERELKEIEKRTLYPVNTAE